MKDAVSNRLGDGGHVSDGSGPPSPLLIPGGKSRDERGTVRFVNGFDLARVRRLYCVRNSEEAPFRGWIAHKIEQKWFFPITGLTAVHLVRVENFEHPAPDLKVELFVLDAEKPATLYVPGGYAIGVETRSPGAEVMVFSDCLLGERPNDVWRWAERDIFGAERGCEFTRTACATGRAD